MAEIAPRVTVSGKYHSSSAFNRKGYGDGAPPVPCVRAVILTDGGGFAEVEYRGAADVQAAPVAQWADVSVVCEVFAWVNKARADVTYRYVAAA